MFSIGILYKGSMNRGCSFPYFANCPSSGFSDFPGRLGTEALVRFLFEFRRPPLGAATSVFGLSVS